MDITINTGVAAKAAAEKLNTVTEVDKSAEKPEIEKTESEVQTRRYDTVELSDEAQKYLAEDANTESEQATAIAANNDSDEELDELYTYTDDELDDLLANGDITQLEYNTEMAKRSSGEE
ncbi:MAG: hypothetical protein ACI4Q4_06600 [Oscillospiraceae bacterium]